MPSHGSISKAGQTRKISPKQFLMDEYGNPVRDKKGRKISVGRKHKGPRVTNRQKYERRMKGDYYKPGGKKW